MPQQFRHRYAAGFHDDLPSADITTGRSYFGHISAVVEDTHCNPAHIRQIGAGTTLLRGFMPLVHFRYTFLVCLPDLQHLTVLLHPGVVRAAPILAVVLRRRLPSACTQLLRQSGRSGLSPLHGQKRLVAHDIPSVNLVRLGGRETGRLRP